ncbi:hypothetical protein TNCV_2583321 [Trichonephila clavipes]|nr:hypothetical protein TNCV_2583321 [Trichonephila clavipes]
MIVGSIGQGMVPPKEDRVSGSHVALYGVRLGRIVLRLRQKFELQLIPQGHNALIEIGYFKDSSEPVEGSSPDVTETLPCRGADER